jgi:hypothetical protein
MQTRQNVTLHVQCVTCYILSANILTSLFPYSVSNYFSSWRVQHVTHFILTCSISDIISISSHVLHGNREIQDTHRSYGMGQHPHFSIARERPPYNEHVPKPDKVEVTLQQKLFLTNFVQ